MLDTIQEVYGSSKRFDLYRRSSATRPTRRSSRAAAAQAAAYLNWAEYISWSDPRIRSYNQYLLSDPPAGRVAFRYRAPVRRRDAEALLRAFRLPIYLPVSQAASGAPLLVWGCVRPALNTAGPTARADRYSNKRPDIIQGSRHGVPITNPNGYLETSVQSPRLAPCWIGVDLPARPDDPQPRGLRSRSS